MTWRVWITIIVGAVIIGAGTWAAADTIAAPRPTLGNIITITPGPTQTPTPAHTTAPTDEADETPIAPPPTAGDDDDSDDIDETDTDVDEPESDSDSDSGSEQNETDDS